MRICKYLEALVKSSGFIKTKTNKVEASPKARECEITARVHRMTTLDPIYSPIRICFLALRHSRREGRWN